MPVFDMAVTGFPKTLETAVEVRYVVSMADFNFPELRSGENEHSKTSVTFAGEHDEIPMGGETRVVTEAEKRVILKADSLPTWTPAIEISTEMFRPA